MRVTEHHEVVFELVAAAEPGRLCPDGFSEWQRSVAVQKLREIAGGRHLTKHVADLDLHPRRLDQIAALCQEFDCVCITDGIPAQDMIAVKRYMWRFPRERRMVSGRPARWGSSTGATRR